MDIKLTIDGVPYTVSPSATGPTGPTAVTGPTGPTVAPTGPTGSTGPNPIPIVAGAPIVPASGVDTYDLLAKNVWACNHDAGTPGTATGGSTYPFTSPDGRLCRQLKFTTEAGGGFIYHGRIADNIGRYNRVRYTKRERKVDPGGWGTIRQCETDIEFTNPKDGTPYDMAMQQSAGSGQEETTDNRHWTPTGIKMDPSKRDNSLWHVTENYLGLTPDNSIMYIGFTQDGVFYPINKTVKNADLSKWGLGIGNFQLQYNGGKPKTEHEILLDVFRFDCWRA